MQNAARTLYRNRLKSPLKPKENPRAILRIKKVLEGTLDPHVDIVVDRPTCFGRYGQLKRVSPGAPADLFSMAKLAVVPDEKDPCLSRNHALILPEESRRCKTRW